MRARDARFGARPELFRELLWQTKLGDFGHSQIIGSQPSFLFALPIDRAQRLCR